MESQRIESKFLVEEYMLLANILIAEHLVDVCGDKAILRAHPDVEDEKKHEINQFLDKLQISKHIDISNSKTLSRSFEKLKA